MLDTLLVEDEDDVRECIASALEDAGHRVTQASDGARAATLIATRLFDLVICDVHLPNVDGLTLVRRLRHLAPATSVVVMTSHGRVEDVVDVMRGGAVDYVTKPFDPEELVARVVRPIAERRALRASLESARMAWVDKKLGAHIAAESRSMRMLLEFVKGFAQSDVSVLLHGERGAGKKSIARVLHEESPRREGPFIVVPCASLPDLMLESELLYLTGSDPSRRDAWFQVAEGGTLVLDGIDELKLSAQSSLVRVLGEPAMAARRDETWQPRGVRVVATSKREPLQLVDGGELLESLYFRAARVVAHVPPLRERQEDLLPLVAELLAALSPSWAKPSSIEPSAIAALARYPFPGNVAELAWALECALFIADTAPIEAKHLPPRIAGDQNAAMSAAVTVS